MCSVARRVLRIAMYRRWVKSDHIPENRDSRRQNRNIL